MSDYLKYYEARDVIQSIVSEDLLGPVFEDEVLNEAPTSYYILGKLYPKTNRDENGDDTTTSADLEDMDEDNTLSGANMRNPRTMGFTYTVKHGVEKLKAKIKYAVYKSYSLSEAEQNGISLQRYSALIEQADQKEKERMVFWKRNSFSVEYDIPTNCKSVIEIAPGVFLKSFLHMLSSEDDYVMTVVLTNEQTVSDDNKILVAEHSVFQPEILLCGIDDSCVFKEVSRRVAITENEELLKLDMLYSDSKCYAHGHGCSVIWDLTDDEPRYIKSSFIPTYNLQQMKATEIKDNPVFNMYYLFSSDHDEVVRNLRSFVNDYRKWIDAGYEESKSPKYQSCIQTAEGNLNECSTICERISRSVDCLENEKGIAWKAFQLANEAMYMQRCKTIEKAAFEKGERTVIDSGKINWYPFQLAFILLEISSFVYPDSPDRKLVDLLWFPTGGGKTESYLGIAAFEIFFRRLSSPHNCNGITVIMRYTLRLLTIQQFERASMLICACELLRKKYRLPGDEISIGLWVGNAFTPGTIDEADRALTKLRVTGALGNEDVNPCQVKICPWCGRALKPINYRINNTVQRMEIICSDSDCEFAGIPLPVRLIDEEIYIHRPAFIVATVDKFAQIAIQEKTSALFSMDSEVLPPELIIQDELHLISGPLGTMTGIYEAAIEKICESKGRCTKIIASTATIRNASNQIKALFGRECSQFPPQGLSQDDSFFAVKAGIEEKPARLYVGIMGVGTTFTTTIIRVYAAWLYASRYLVDLGYDENVVDNFWTLTGYFNSIRELGATQTQIVDDIQSRYKYLKENKFKSKYPDYSGEEKYENCVELTSRMSNDEISVTIQKDLKRKFELSSHSDVYDFVLASNMISVGVDVGRLGTMVVAGQSKTNAEYIQATSRVGRSNPGLVFTVYNASRSRDRSHYEQFSRYHSALYRYVEASSLTPFSDRARDRGLQALFIILCRYLCPELMADNAAGNFSMDLPRVKKAEELIVEYVSVIDERETDHVLKEIKDIEKKWTEATRVGELWYRKKGKAELLKPDTNEGDRFRIMNSMRSVEPESGICLMGENE